MQRKEINMNKNDKKYFKEMIEDNDLFHVSIPMTVLGGLQFYVNPCFMIGGKSFNTDDGIRRAARVLRPCDELLITQFQYR